MEIKKILEISKNDLFALGQKFFYVGLFLLPTIQPLSFASFLIALIISLTINKQNYIHDKWNLFLLFSSGFIIFNTLNFLLFNTKINNPDDFLILIFNALKWITLFISFTSFQCYLKTNLQRINFAKYFLIGSIPIFISCFLQYWFKIYGPFEFINGFIVWYNKPLLGPDAGVSGLFSNQNYTGFWLSIIWPFSIYFLSKYKFLDIKKILYIFLSGFTIYLIFMTTSRASILGLIISLPLIFSIKLLIKLVFILVFFYLLISNIPEALLIQSDIYIPKTIKILIGKFMNFNISDIQNITRIKIWGNTLGFISTKPFLGYGAGLFPIIYLTLSDYSAQHAHNIILQIAFDYGLLLSLGLSAFVFILLYKTWQKIFTYSSNLNSNEKPFEIYWFASTLVAVVSQIYDVTYFDGRVSMLIWLLLSGLKSIIDDDLQNLKSK